MVKESGTTTAYLYQKISRPVSDLSAFSEGSGIDLSTGYQLIKQINVNLHREINRLREENQRLRAEVTAMKSNNFAEEVLELRDIPRGQAKAEIKAYFESHHGETIYPSDLMENLNLDYDLIWELCDELEKEGKIKGS